MIKPIPEYEDHLWYPIIVTNYLDGTREIVEMQGREVNAYNRIVNHYYSPQYPRGWRI